MDSFGERKSLLLSIPKMIAYLKEHEKKTETAQIGLFDFSDGDTPHASAHFDLEKTVPMTFEERIK
jgi:hypothetical protein